MTPPATHGSNPPLLRVEDLTKAFGGVRAADHLSFELRHNELRCLIGPNGAGKSTLFGLLSGIHQPDNGKILFNGEDITRLPPFRRVKKGLCQKFQTTRIYRGMTVGQNLLIASGGGNVGAHENERLAWALDTLHLDAHRDTPAGLLPYSLQQWLEICLALATEPKLLLVDEPAAGMTPEEAALTAGFLQELNGKRLAVMVVEHDMSFVRKIGGRVTVLHYGRIFSEGTIDDIEADAEVRRIYLGEQ
jgi:branched-chain amino acid transport system ATP-binding protein